MEKLELQKIANEVRKDIVTAVHAAKAGHPGGSLSAADLFTKFKNPATDSPPAEAGFLSHLIYNMYYLSPNTAL